MKKDSDYIFKKYISETDIPKLVHEYLNRISNEENRCELECRILNILEGGVFRILDVKY